VQTGWLLAVPLGATEQHGPHLPLSTDTQIADVLAQRLAADNAGVVAAPPVSYGASGEHQSFSGTLSVGQEALEMFLVELGRSAAISFPRVLFVSAHGGNFEPVSCAVRRLRAETRDVLAWSPGDTWSGDAHAGRTETSVMLAIDRTSVRHEAIAPGNREPLDRLLPQLRREGVEAVSPSGVLGDPRGSTVQLGERLLAQAADALASAIGGWPEPGAERIWL
jgi:mycofactocin precursor peptide peptidase